MHARAPSGRDHGFGRRSLRCLLRIRTPSTKSCERVEPSPRAGGALNMNANALIDKTTDSYRDKILRKCGESVEMKEKFFSKYAERIEAMTREMAERFRAGKKLLVMGNGGSLCDALHFCVEFTHPIIEKRQIGRASCRERV